MADTLGDMVNEIVDESRRSMSTTIERLIFDAIEHYEPERFWFHERTETFSISSSQDTYTSVDASFIPRVMEFDALRLTVSTNDKPTLDKWTWRQMEDLNYPSSSGRPQAYAYWGESIRFYPIPDAGYEIRFSGVVQEPTLSASTDSNAWTTRGKGKQLIKQRAKSLLYSELLRDDVNAGRAIAREKEALQKLKDRSAKSQGTDEIEPSL